MQLQELHTSGYQPWILLYTFNHNFPINCGDNEHMLQMVTTGAGQRFTLPVELNIGLKNYPPFSADAGDLLEIHPSLVPPPKAPSKGGCFSPSRTGSIHQTHLI